MVKRIDFNNSVTVAHLNGKNLITKESNWIIKVNPNLLPLSKRVTSSRQLYKASTNLGWWKYCCGIVPLPKYTEKGNFLQRFMRNTLGLCLDRHEQGYILVEYKGLQYFVQIISSKGSPILGDVYRLGYTNRIGSCSVTSDLKVVRLYYSDSKVKHILEVIALCFVDYIMRTLLTSVFSTSVEIK